MSLTDVTTLSNGVKMPWVGLGVYKMDSGEEVVNAVRSALDLGYRHLDTASFYDNEEGVGQAIKESGIPREELFITTKVWNDEQGYEETLEAFDRSREKLGVDYLDLYLIHWPIQGRYKDTWKALEKLYKDGKVKAIGVSNFLTHHLDDLLKDAEIKPMVNQVELHPELYQKEMIDYCKQQDIQVEAWSPIGRGNYLDNPVLQELAEEYNKTPAQIILRWDLQHGIVTIPKSTHKERQQENADLFDFELTDNEVEKINGLNKNNRLGPHPDEIGK
ncbi:aldo/keto reductase [Halobacillus shinanisalinarum]|uniref:Aldo/keto reductase n=1 Tax=Halobacillus shinanisalinarum TaxID=2932258 RepID=A0ABY4GX05_9BACI|nr:aldo/keto reductase [Halobacillus shinanisalinarum]UOQ92668.1 aldo/keto reductase [Halobacillus shinanisalinarum]